MKLFPEDYELQDPATVPIKKEEAREQARLVAGLRKTWAPLPEEFRPIVLAIPNGGSRDAREGANLKVQGVLAGAPDLLILFPAGITCLIEMKARDGTVSKAQHELHPLIHALCHTLILAYSAEEALAALRERYS
jgi:hypothetical protein